MTEPATQFDDFSPKDSDDRFAVYAALRDNHPVAYSSLQGGAWMLSRYADVRKAIMDWQTFTSSVPGSIVLPHTSPPEGLTGIPIEYDPPQHTKYREALADFFSRPVVDRWEPAVRQAANELLDGLAAKPGCDMVGDYAFPLSIRALALFFGLPPEHIEQWDKWTGEVFSSRTSQLERQARAFQEMIDYLDEQFAERRRRPGEDYFSLLTTIEIDGRKLTDAELRGYGRMMIIAGRGATIDALGNGLWYLAEHPEVRRQLLNDPELLRSAVEEFLRLMTPLSWLGRIATRDVTIHGQTIRQGDAVAFTFSCANLDERMFPEPEKCVLGRRPNPHMAFGAGPHSCLGAHVARLIIRVGLGEWLARIPNFRLTQSNPPQLAISSGLFSFQELPVSFDSEEASHA